MSADMDTSASTSGLIDFFCCGKRERNNGPMEEKGQSKKGPVKEKKLSKWNVVREKYGSALLSDSPQHREVRDKIAVSLKNKLMELRRQRRDPVFIDVPKKLQRFCHGKDKVRKPAWLTPNCIFLSAHFLALFVAAYGILWSGLSMYYGRVLGGPLWLPLHLFKLGYPMVPVVLGCWIARRRHDGERGWKLMTPGYYFANMKMSLMVSLGPGLLIGAGGKLVVLKLLGVERELGLTYSQFLLPVAWLFGCMAWYFVANSFYAKYGSPLEEKERCRAHWGLYARWVVDIDPSKPWQECIRAGPHWLAGVIPAARHGTFHKIGEADKLRAIGITLCCAIAWLMLIIAGFILPGLTAMFHEWDATGSAIAMLIHTDGPNLITNTLTAPMLIYHTWRPEPGAKSMFQVVMHAVASERKHATIEIDQRNGQPWVLHSDIDNEVEKVLQQVVAAVVLSGPGTTLGDSA